MEWFNGSVGNAVNKAKHNRSFFVVYVEGKDRLSEIMTSVIDSEDISKILETGNYVSVRVKFGSKEYQEFVEIYKHVPVPSFFLIGLNGIPLAVISNTINQDVTSLHDQILEAIVLKDKFRSADNSFALLAASKTDNGSDISMEDETNTYDFPSSNSQKGSSAGAKKSFTIGRDSVEGKAAGSSNFNESEDTIERPANQDDKQNKNNPSRVQLNPNDDIRVQEMLQEKLRNELDRKRVLNDIAMDKQERASWRQEMKATRCASVSNESDSKGPERSDQTPLRASQTRIQFRMANGATYTEVFNVHDVLLELQRYVIENVRMQSPRFQLATAFPRHVFTEVEYVETLQALNLVPNAVILIIPHAEDNSPVSYIYSQLSNTFWFITSPIAGLYRSIVGDSEQPHVDEEVHRSASDNPAYQSENSNHQRNSNQLGTSTGRTYFTMEDINKDNNNKDRNDVWNGNSTQQIQ